MQLRARDNLAVKYWSFISYTIDWLLTHFLQTFQIFCLFYTEVTDPGKLFHSYWLKSHKQDYSKKAANLGEIHISLQEWVKGI